MHKYSININFSEEDDGYIATIPAFPGLSAFGETPEKALEEAKIVLQGFIDVYKEDNIPLPEPDIIRPYSGQIRVRLPMSLHAELSEAARHEGTSLNTYIVYLLSGKHQLKQAENSMQNFINYSLLNNSFSKTTRLIDISVNGATRPFTIPFIIDTSSEKDKKLLS